MSRKPELRLIASKGWSVRATQSLNELLQKHDIAVVALNETMEEFDDRLVSFDDIESELEHRTETEEEILECVDKAAVFRENAHVSRVNAASKLLELLQSDELDDDKLAYIFAVNIKLFKLTLPKLNGDVLEWQSFGDQGECSWLRLACCIEIFVSVITVARQRITGCTMTFCDIWSL